MILILSAKGSFPVLKGRSGDTNQRLSSDEECNHSKIGEKWINQHQTQLDED
jgi:hypothetical protein